VNLRGPTAASVIIALLALIVLIAATDAVLAQQTGPFGAPRPPATAHAEGVVGWVLDQQARFYRQLSGLIRAAKADGSAVWTLLGLSFLYGVFHAAGPGHGKAVISSYMVASGETWRRGVMLSFISAAAQAAVAVILVAVAAGVIGVTARVMREAERWIEIASYGLIVAVGLSLTWSKARALVQAWHAMAGLHHEHVQDRSCHQDKHDHDDHHHHDHAGHSHGPMPQELAGPGGWRRGLSAVIATGLRPCSGAILVLVFALAQGLFWAGIAATFVIGLGTALTVAAIAVLAVNARSLASRFAREGDGGRGALILRGLELGAAVLVLAFGVALLSGYAVSERLL
jgi:nickel/cobalt exporter